MIQIIRPMLPVLLGVALVLAPAHANNGPCERLLTPVQRLLTLPGQTHSSYLSSAYKWIKRQSIDLTLNVMGYYRGLPKYIKRISDLQKSGQYLKYDNFGEMGLAELGVSVSFNHIKLAALNTNKPLIIVANHHLGIADGLALQYLSSMARRNQPSLLLLARWIEKLLPNAIFGDEQGWGTAIPVEINKPKEDDPDFDKKMADVKAFNSGWNKKTIRALKAGGAIVIFPAGQVAALHKNDGNQYPDNIYDAEDSWKVSVLNMAKLGNADVVFANVDSVNSEAFYKNRKRFGGGDKERVIWFFSEALGKANSSVDVFFSDPININDLHGVMAEHFAHSEEELKNDMALMAELMRLYTYEVQDLYPQELNTVNSPERLD